MPGLAFEKGDKESLRRELIREAAQFIRDNPEHLPEFIMRSPSMTKDTLQRVFKAAYQYAQGIAPPMTHALQIESVWSDAVDLYAKQYAKEELIRRGLEV